MVTRMRHMVFQLKAIVNRLRPMKHPLNYMELLKLHMESRFPPLKYRQKIRMVSLLAIRCI